MCVGFLLNTVVHKALSGLGMTRVSRKGMHQSGLVSSVVNWIWGSMELMGCRNLFLCSIFWILNVPSIYLYHSLWGLRDGTATMEEHKSNKCLWMITAFFLIFKLLLHQLQCFKEKVYGQEGTGRNWGSVTMSILIRLVYHISLESDDMIS